MTMIVVALLTLTSIIIVLGVFIMAAIDNLNIAVAELQTTVNNLVLPSNNDVAIQAAADSITSSVAALNAKVAPA